MINNPPPFKGVNTRIPIIIPIKGNGSLIRGLHYPRKCAGRGLHGHPSRTQASPRQVPGSLLEIGFRV